MTLPLPPRFGLGFLGLPAMNVHCR